MSSKAILAILLASSLSLHVAAKDMEDELRENIRKNYASRGVELTTEQENMLVNAFMAKLGKISKLASGESTIIVEKAPRTNTSKENIDEAEFAKKFPVNAIKAGELQIQRGRDGFLVNGQPYIDPEGKIISYAYDVATGDVSYTVRSDSNQLTFKYTQAGIDQDPISFATAIKNAQGWQVKTATGKSMVGELIAPLARGIMVSRAGAVFRYTPGIGIKSTAIPDGFFPTPLQRGNVSATAYILLEKIAPVDNSGGLLSLIETVKDIGALVGTNKKEDYALYNLDTRKLIPLNIIASGKNQHSYSNCKATKSKYINSCANMDSFESLYRDTGTKNMGHYFWSVDWQKASNGTFLSYLDTGTKAIAMDITSGKRSLIYNRVLGISSLDSGLNADGTMSVSTGWMGEMKKINDIGEFIKTADEIPNENTSTPP
jgi:hypothetical protein